MRVGRSSSPPLVPSLPLPPGRLTFTFPTSVNGVLWQDVPIGDGGCVAHALHAAGVWNTAPDAMAALNAEIEPVRRKFRPDQRGEEYVGKPNDRWHPEVVQRAVVNKGYHFRKVDLINGNLKKEMESGCFLVDGVLNDTYVIPMEKDEYEPEWVASDNTLPEGKGRLYTCPGDETSPDDDEAGWRHAILVKDGRVLDRQVEKAATLSLHLGNDNKPDPDKGYMRKIYKVYRIFPCTAKEKGCKGECEGKQKRKAQKRA